MKKKAVGIVGLGIMGSAMAGSLARNGFAVHGYDVVPSRMKQEGVQACPLKDISARARIVITSLPSAAALHAVSRKISSGIVVETSTLPIEDKQRARETLAKKRITLLDCPLSGTGAQARAGDLVVFASGDKAAFSSALPVLKGFSRAQYHVGEFGNGSRMKFVANLLVAIHNVSAAEAFVLGMKSGLSPQMIFKVMSDGAGSSRMLQVRGPQMVAGRYREATMSNALWQKDMKIIGEFAAAHGAPTPLFNASAAIYSAAMAQGFAQEDTAAVCAVLERMAGLRRRA